MRETTQAPTVSLISFYLITDCKLGSATASINVTSTVPSNPTYEELVTSNTNTTKFEYYISPKQYTFGPETNRAVRIHIYDFQAPLKIQVWKHFSVSTW